MAEEEERGEVEAVGGVGGDEGGEGMDVGRGEAVEEEAGVGKVGESCGGEAEELEGGDLGLGVAESDGQSLHLLQMV